MAVSNDVHTGTEETVRLTEIADGFGCGKRGWGSRGGHVDGVDWEKSFLRTVRGN